MVTISPGIYFQRPTAARFGEGKQINIRCFKIKDALSVEKEWCIVRSLRRNVDQSKVELRPVRIQIRSEAVRVSTSTIPGRYSCSSLHRFRIHNLNDFRVSIPFIHV
jgi:hypothetical protein